MAVDPKTLRVGDVIIDSVGSKHTVVKCHNDKVDVVQTGEPFDLTFDTDLWERRHLIQSSRIPITKPAEQIEVNAKGGKQSRLDTRFDLLPPLALAEVARVLKRGNDKYETEPSDDGKPNWHKITVAGHLNHLLHHVNAYLAGDPVEGDLGHAATRALMALEVLLIERKVS